MKVFRQEFVWFVWFVVNSLPKPYVHAFVVGHGIGGRQGECNNHLAEIAEARRKMRYYLFAFCLQKWKNIFIFLGGFKRKYI